MVGSGIGTVVPRIPARKSGSQPAKVNTAIALPLPDAIILSQSLGAEQVISGVFWHVELLSFGTRYQLGIRDILKAFGL